MRDDRGRVRRTRQTFNEVGHAHELTFSCHRGLPLLFKDRTRAWFVEALDRARRVHDFSLWAYVVMPEHAHVLLFPNRNAYDVSVILKSVKQSVSRRAIDYLRAQDEKWLERLKVTWPSGRFEYRFWQQGGGYDRNIMEPGTAWRSVQYLHMNPARRGLVEGPLYWEWSSARWYAGMAEVVLKMDGVPPG